jgi:hypothetical protein
MFAILFAADLSVTVGAVEIWKLANQSWLPITYRLVAAGMLVLTLLSCLIAVRFERTSARARDDYDQELGYVERGGLILQDPAVLRWRYRVFWAWSYMIRSAVMSFHLWWIVKIPRWALLS